MRRLGAWVAGIAALFVLTAPPALAHVDLATSFPESGDLVRFPVDEITLLFTADAAPAGDGILLYNAAAEIMPAAVEIVSDTEVRLIPEDTLESGRYAVAWTMKAGDAHPRSGAIEFAVDAAVAAAATTPSTTLAPGPPSGSESSIETGEATGPDTAVEADEGPTDLENTTLFAGASTEPVAPIITVAGPSASGEWISRSARGASMLASLLGIGALIFAYLVFEGSSLEARRIGFWVRRAGLVLVAAAPLEIIGQSMLLHGTGIGALSPGALADATGGGLGTASLLRVAGGTAMLAGTRLTTVLKAIPPDRPPGGSATATMVRRRFRVTASPIAVTGALATASSFVLDGHSATEGPRLLVQSASLAHVLAAATWVGGVVFLAATLMGRHRRDEPLDAARLVIPFSSVASVAVVFVGLAGAVLAFAIVDAPGDFIGTGWGRLLLAKLGLVAIAGAMGAYNHFVAVPALRLGADDPATDVRLRTMMRIEAAVLVGVAISSAILVGLSP
jgi:copper transport protein